MKSRGLSPIARTIACILTLPIIVFGLYIIIHGHLTPGGGFPGGAIMATLVALFLVTFEDIELERSLFSLLESIALIAFIMIAFIGISNSFFHNFLANSQLIFGRSVSFGHNPGYLNSGGTVPLMNIAVGFEVFSAISIILMLIKGDRE